MKCCLRGNIDCFGTVQWQTIQMGMDIVVSSNKSKTRWSRSGKGEFKYWRNPIHLLLVSTRIQAIKQCFVIKPIEA